MSVEHWSNKKIDIQRKALHSNEKILFLCFAFVFHLPDWKIYSKNGSC